MYGRVQYENFVISTNQLNPSKFTLKWWVLQGQRILAFVIWTHPYDPIQDNKTAGDRSKALLQRTDQARSGLKDGFGHPSTVFVEPGCVPDAEYHSHVLLYLQLQLQILLVVLKITIAVRSAISYICIYNCNIVY